MTENDPLGNQKQDDNNNEKQATIFVQKIKKRLSELKKDRLWLAKSLNRSISTVNGWLSAGKPIPNECINEIRVLFEKEQRKQKEERKSITAESDKEWETWQIASQIEFADSVESWARNILNEWAIRVNSRSNELDKGEYIWIHPNDENSLLLWRSAFFADTSFMRTYGNLKKDPSSIIEEILNKEAQEIIAREKEKNNSFSLKSVELGQFDGISEEEAKERIDVGEYVYYFTQANAYLWLVVCGIENKNVNTWANEILDRKAEEAIFNRIKSNVNPDDEILF